MSERAQPMGISDTTRAGGSGLRVYVRTRPVERMSWAGRGVALGVAVVCLGVLVVAVSLTPDARGLGTHLQLGMRACGMMEVFGLPCPTCGFTTSFALFADGRWWASFVNQPAGFAAAVVCGCAFWAGLWAAVTGQRVHQLLTAHVTVWRVVAVVVGVLAAWGWKVAVTASGLL